MTTPKLYQTIIYKTISVLWCFCITNFLMAPTFAADALTETQAQQLARQFYDAKGEWAGKFHIARFLKTRFETLQAQSAVVHFQYEWAFLQDPTRTGIDNRYFVYQKSGNAWSVVEMGAHQSGRP